MIRIAFTDFWPKFQPRSGFKPILNLLSELYNIEIVNKDPDFLFFSIFGEDYRTFNCRKIFYSAENRADDPVRFKNADWSMSHHYRAEKTHYRLPNWLRRFGFHILEELKQPRNLEEKKKFCNFLYSNSRPLERKKFFQKLSRYKQVDAGGAVFNNIGEKVPHGQGGEWMSDYKFSISFENESVEGYTTEKIIRAYQADTIPIYWGNPRIEEDFNEESFINIHNFDSFDSAVDYVKKVDQDFNLYKSVMQEPLFLQVPDIWRRENFETFLFNIFEED